MTENHKGVSWTYVEQNKTIAQIGTGLKRIRESENFAITDGVSVPTKRGSPFHSHSLNPPENIPNNPHITPTQKLPTIDSTILNSRQVSLLYQTLPLPANSDINNHVPIQNNQNLLNTQHMPSNSHKSYPFYPTYIEPKEKENEWRTNEGMIGQSIKDEIMKAVKEFHHTSDVAGLNYEDLCIHPDLDLPKGFKVPKFDTFDGTGNPLTHLKTYCSQLVGVGKNESLLMRLFSRSLKGEALEWFTSQEVRQWSSWRTLAKDFVERFGHNIEVAPDRYYLEKIKQKSMESYREYALRWRREAARVQPPMSECEIIEMFIRIQKPEYYERMLCMIGRKFIDVVKVGEVLEDDFKTGKITLRVNEEIMRASDVKKSEKEEKEVSVVRVIPSKWYQNCHDNQGKSSRPTFRKLPKIFTPLKESQTQLYERLKAAGMLHPIKGRPAITLGKFYRADHRCAYHSGAIGHDTENCSTLKHKIQNMLDNNLITIDEASPSDSIFYA